MAFAEESFDPRPRLSAESHRIVPDSLNHPTACKMEGECVFTANMLRPLSILIAAWLLLPLLVTVALGAGENISSKPGFVMPADSNMSDKLQLQADISYIEESDFSNGLGSVEVTRLGISADYAIFNISYGLSHFSWTQKSDVPIQTRNAGGGVAPWNNMHDLTLQARLINGVWDKKWSYWMNGQVTSAFERDFPGAVGAGIDGGVAYDLWDGWMIGGTLNAVALSALRDDLFGEVEFGLIVAASQRAFRNAMRSIGFENASGGSDDIGFSFAFTSAKKTYRFSPDSMVYRNGYLGVFYSKIGAYLDYMPSDMWTLSIGPEFHYNRKYEIYDSTGALHSSHRLDNGWGGHVRVLWRY